MHGSNHHSYGQETKMDNARPRSAEAAQSKVPKPRYPRMFKDPWPTEQARLILSANSPCAWQILFTIGTSDYVAGSTWLR